MRKYEHELKVPYHLLFAPDKQKVTLYHHTGERYVAIKPDDNGRYEIEEVEIAVGLLDGCATWKRLGMSWTRRSETWPK